MPPAMSAVVASTAVPATTRRRVRLGVPEVVRDMGCAFLGERWVEFGGPRCQGAPSGEFFGGKRRPLTHERVNPSRNGPRGYPGLPSGLARTGDGWAVRRSGKVGAMTTSLVTG